ncbi:hypothetical protein [Raoultibacter massiliensis]
MAIVASAKGRYVAARSHSCESKSAENINVGSRNVNELAATKKE